MLGASFGEHKRAMGKIESGQTPAASQLCTRRPPVQTTSNHQVQHQPEIAFYADGNSLADSPQLAHYAALHARDWRLRGAQQKGACQSHVLNGLPDDAGFK